MTENLAWIIIVAEITKVLLSLVNWLERDMYEGVKRR